MRINDLKQQITIWVNFSKDVIHKVHWNKVQKQANPIDSIRNQASGIGWGWWVRESEIGFLICVLVTTDKFDLQTNSSGFVLMCIWLHIFFTSTKTLRMYPLNQFLVLVKRKTYGKH